MVKIEFDEKEKKMKSLSMKGVNLDEFFKKEIKSEFEKYEYYPMMLVLIDKESKIPVILSQYPEDIKTKEITLMGFSDESVDRFKKIFRKMKV